MPVPPALRMFHVKHPFLFCFDDLDERAAGSSGGPFDFDGGR